MEMKRRLERNYSSATTSVPLKWCPDLHVEASGFDPQPLLQEDGFCGAFELSTLDYCKNPNVCLQQ
jgi:hypothetical protein